MNRLSLPRTLTLLERLRGTLADFAAREQQLTKGLHARRVTLQRRLESEAGSTALAEQLAQTQAAYDAEEARLRTASANRRARLERIHSRALLQAPRKAVKRREAWLGDLQWQLRNAEQQRVSDLEAAGRELEEWKGKLIAEHERVVAMERKAYSRLRSHFSFRRALATRLEVPAPDFNAPMSKYFAAVGEALNDVQERLAAMAKYGGARFFRAVPITFLFFVCLLGSAAAVWRLGSMAGVIGAVTFAALLALYIVAGTRARSAALAVVDSVRKLRLADDVARLASTEQYHRRCQEIEDTYRRTHDHITSEWNRAAEVEHEFAVALSEKAETQAARLKARLARQLHPKLKNLAANRFRHLAQLEEEGRQRQAEHQNECAEMLTAHAADEATKWAALEAAWQQATEPLFAEIAEMQAMAEARFPAWSESAVEDWKPAVEFPEDVKFGRLEVDARELAGALPQDPRLPLPGPAQFALPLALDFPHQGSLLFESKEAAGALIGGCLNNIVLRLLVSAPPGKITFTIVDPVGLGQNFAGLMHLSDYEEAVINRRIWTQQNQIEERLSELNEHIEKVIQMYLRNEFATIAEYNAQAGSVAEKAHFLVIADFPTGFSETAVQRLQSIITSGPRCGVYTLIHWDRRRLLPEGLATDELRRSSVVLSSTGGRVTLEKLASAPGATLVLDEPAAPDLAARLVHRIGRGSVDSGRVEVPFTQIAPPLESLWQNDTTTELRVPIGRTGATKLQYLAIGKGTRQHALFAGKTGSGKSTLFHVIITNLALWCSPEQVEFYLIDFKKGVEFKCYAEKRLPHARVVAIESDREFALSVLQRVDEELRRRGDLFRKLGVQDLAGYQRLRASAAADAPWEPMPRTLLIIDEFQEFFVEDDTIAQNASLLFDRIVRQGRAFGIHVLLGSQTLGGAYTLARATLGQMVIRVALQCNEADAYLIMDENNAAPRLLSRPGEGIYNDSAGAVEGNSPFQVVWLSDEERDRWLQVVRDRAARQEAKYPSPIVFEGNSPAEVRDNELLQRLLVTEPMAPLPLSPRFWLGAPNSIKGPTEAVFHRQSGNNLLIVGQREETALTMQGLALLTLAAQFPANGARFYFFHSAPPGSPEALYLEQIAEGLPQGIKLITPPDSAAAMAELGAELKTRTADEALHQMDIPVFVFIQGLQKFKKLRQEDEFSFSSPSEDEPASPAANFSELIFEGSAHGIHLIVSADTFNSVNRFINRKALSEWEMRVVFQMSANDSASLIDSPLAGQLGLHRAIFYSERAGTVETFRPYAMPDETWLADAEKRLAQRRHSPNKASEALES